MNYYYLIIATKEKIKLNLSLDVLYINNDFIIVDDHHIKYEDKLIEFEYMIYSNLLKINYEKSNLILLEDMQPITNFYHQTSIENIYFITEENTQSKILDIINNE